jgi:hypothetical protein
MRGEDVAGIDVVTPATGYQWMVLDTFALVRSGL